MTSTVRQRLLGILFLLICIGFLAFTILQFNKAFTSFTTVKFTTDSAGNALPNAADVKARGVIVGEVRDITPSPDGKVVVTLGLNPDMAKKLPVETTARILPKTLFGERFVDLKVPDTSGGPTLASTKNAVIYTDQSGNAKEIQEMFDKLLPVLKAVPPQDLNITLTALSKALSGRGDELRTTITDLNKVFSGINKVLPDLEGTLRGLSDFSQTYSEALPDIIDGLDNLRTTGNTIVEKQSDLRNLISTLGAAATDTTSWLRTNRRDLLDVVIKGEPFMRGLARQSPSFGCTFENFASIFPESDRVTGKGSPNPGPRVNLQFVNPRGRYLPNQDEPRFFDYNRPATCFGPATDNRPFPQYPGGGLGEGSYQPPSRNAGPTTVPNVGDDFPITPPNQNSVIPAGTIGDTTLRANPYDNAEYVNQLKVVYASTTGNDPDQVPTWVTMIGGMSLQGAQVNIQ
ncbi:MCE family protein [Gordonia pseudamarae]|uniref:MCE family protein n=1 Tax=Gordonia pseudamarae TaxID=2831662 RepID=A0ABX6IN12_9ACTN|nr:MULTISPECIES: MCE family protein [Gordonia]MBD0021263.1 MCE family protein [Gordonia sp. (in: high G+C Gram-positive bacteria)]QHN27624.1 MCE family protein [Gordonia pseudamarae]QHN36506.1 MCE family protein [Gordonia pseudamarae]